MAHVNPIPEGANTVIANLLVRDCAKAIDFYVRALGATEVARVPAPDGKSIWHAELEIGNSTLYLNDEMTGSPIHAPSTEQRSPVVFWIWVKDCDAAFRRAIEAGGKSWMEPTDMFWGDRSAEVADPYGYFWNFATHVKDMTPDEMKKAGEEFARTLRRG